MRERRKSAKLVNIQNEENMYYIFIFNSSIFVSCVPIFWASIAHLQVIAGSDDKHGCQSNGIDQFVASSLVSRVVDL